MQSDVRPIVFRPSAFAAFAIFAACALPLAASPNSRPQVPKILFLIHALSRNTLPPSKSSLATVLYAVYNLDSVALMMRGE
jgi:hypothetical protein